MPKSQTSDSILDVLALYYNPPVLLDQDQNLIPNLDQFIGQLKATDPLLKDAFTYVVNTADQSYHYLSDNIEAVLGISKEDFIQQGVKEVFARMDEQSVALHQKYYDLSFTMFRSPEHVGDGKRVSGQIVYRFHKSPTEVIWIKQYNFVFLNAEANVLLDYGMVSRSQDTAEQYYHAKFVRHEAQGEVVLQEYLLPSKDLVRNLSKRELEVLEGYQKGQSPDEIGGALHIAVQTVYQHRKSICKKMGVDRITQAVALLNDK